MRKTAVLSRYKESNNIWHKYLEDMEYEILVYNKFSGNNLLPNIGRESHTFLRYIIDNYDKLPDEVLFSQYDPRDHFNEKYIYDYKNKDSMNYFLYSNLYDFIGIRPTDYELVIRGRYIDWYKFCNNLFNKNDYSFLSKIIATGCTINGIFRVTKNAILNNSIDLYKKGIKLLEHSIDPYEGYCFERIWKFLFTKYGYIDNNKYDIFKNRIFLFGTPSHKTKGRHQAVKGGAYGHIKLSDDGTITSNISYYSNYNESFWRINNDFLYIFSADGCVTSKYNLLKITNLDKDIIIGDLYNHNLISLEHFWLKPILFGI